MRAICEWGLAGLEALKGEADVFVVVDVLSFSTCVDVACGRGAIVFPFPFGDRDKAAAEASRRDAILAGRRYDLDARYSLSPPTLEKLDVGERLLLPSPNGSRISFAAGDTPVLAGCLRNATAVARTATEIAAGGTVAVIPAGERWPDGSLRPAIEDLLGAGAILNALTGNLSPEARIARSAFEAARPDLSDVVRHSVSGRELVDLGFPQDVEMALDLNASGCAPVLVEGAFRARG